MSKDTTKHVKITQTKDGRWSVCVFDDNGVFEEEHVIDAEPTTETVRALIEETATHHDALERLVNR